MKSSPRKNCKGVSMPHLAPCDNGSCTRNTAVRQARGRPSATATRWRELAPSIQPRLLSDPFWPQLADGSPRPTGPGIDIPALARTARRAGTALRSTWTAALFELIGAAATRRVLADPAWPALARPPNAERAGRGIPEARVTGAARSRGSDQLIHRSIRR
jgi:hypothetical protein